MDVTGSGFAPNATITMSWADGSGGTTTAVTDAAGGLSVQVVVRATDRTGQRTLVAQSSGQAADQVGDQVATVDVLVLAPGSTRGPNSPVWPGP